MFAWLGLRMLAYKHFLFPLFLAHRSLPIYLYFLLYPTGTNPLSSKPCLPESPELIYGNATDVGQWDPKMCSVAPRSHASATHAPVWSTIAMYASTFRRNIFPDACRKSVQCGGIGYGTIDRAVQRTLYHCTP